MPILSVAIWPHTDEKYRELIERLTETTHQVTGAPLDKITVCIHEVPQARWGTAGVAASQPQFQERSRRLEY